ncbi:transporter substrate-binding domain-containing protein [Burkholderia sp. MR1-5-21]
MKALKPILMAGLAATVLCVTAASASAADLLDSVKQAGVIQVGLEGTYPPFGYRDSDGALAGFDVDVAKAVADRLHVKPNFVATEWSGIFGGLQAGKFDTIANEVAITPARKQSVDFSQPYVYSSAQLIQRADDKRDLKSLADMKAQGLKVGVVTGSAFQDIAKGEPGLDARNYPDTATSLSDLVSGRIDAVINDRLVIPYLIRTSHLPLRPGVALAQGRYEMGFPFRKGNPKFASSIDGALTSMQQDGTLKKIAIKWFGVDTTTPPTN